MNLAPLLDRVEGAVASDAFGLPRVEVPVGSWAVAVGAAREVLGFDVLDFLGGVDEPAGLRVVCHLLRTDPFDHLLLSTRLSEDACVADVSVVHPGAAWHQRETAEMFGVRFTDAAGQVVPVAPLLLPDGFLGHPLRKDHVLGSRLDRPWPGAKEGAR